MIIDCHAHICPPSLIEAIRANAASFPSLKLVEDGAGGFGLSFAGGKPTRPVAKPLRVRLLHPRGISPCSTS